MPLPKQHTQLTQKQSNKQISLISNFLYFDLFSFKKYHQSSFLIPDTILLQKGHIKEWYFNSQKQQNKILKKRKENNKPINVIKHFCYQDGEIQNLMTLNTISQIKNALEQVYQEKYKNNKVYKQKIQENKVIQIISIDNDIFSMNLLDFISSVEESNYNQHVFYQKWKIIRQKVNYQSKIDQSYHVQNIRKNHVIQSKCHKIIALNTTQLNSYPSTDMQSLHNYQKMNPPRNIQATQTKNIQGYKFFDSYLNKKFFSISEEIIQFIEKNYKCIVEEVKTKFIINKNRQPHLIGIQNLIIKPVKKLANSAQYKTFKGKGYLKVEEYLKCLTIYINQHEKSNQLELNIPINKIKSLKCHGDFCKIIALRLPHLIGSLQASKSFRSFSLDPSSHHLNKFKVLSDLIIAVKKRKGKILQKLAQNSIINENDAHLSDDSSQYSDSDDETGKNVKVCQNCHTIYMHINKLYEFDIRSGNLIEKKQIISHNSIKNRSQSQKLLLPPINTSHYLDESKMQSKDREDTPIISSKKLNIDPKLKAPISSIDRRHTLSSQKLRERISSERQTVVLVSTAKNSLTKIKPQISKSRPKLLQTIQTKQLKSISTKGNRLISLSKTGLNDEQFKRLKNNPKLNTMLLPKQLIVKAKNYQQSQQNLVNKLSLLPSASLGQFIHYAKRYYQTNLPQQLDRRCFSSQYISHLYSFMMNSPLNLHPKNRIKKRPQISLMRLSQLTNDPQIVSKSAFHFDTLITDEKTTISFCVITTKMINGVNSVGVTYENIIVINDIFDCFIEYISLAKDMLENAVNKRVILFNYPGHSHTIYNSQEPMHFPKFTDIMDKLLYRLSENKDQLGYINYKKDKFKFIGFGYGGGLIAQYLGNCYYDGLFNQNNLTGVMLVNTYKHVTKQWKEKAQALLQLYSSNDQTAKTQAYLFYNKAIQSSELDKQQLEYKAGLNPIRIQGRAFLLKSLLDVCKMQQNNHNTMIELFESINFCPVHIVYGRLNNLFSKIHAQRFLKYQDTKVEKLQIPFRKFIELQGGHDILADNYEGLLKYIELFLKV